MSRPLPERNQPRNGNRRKPKPITERPPVLITPPAVRTPTTRPRSSVLIAWAKISAFEKLFWLQSTTIGFCHFAYTIRPWG